MMIRSEQTFVLALVAQAALLTIPGCGDAGPGGATHDACIDCYDAGGTGSNPRGDPYDVGSISNDGGNGTSEPDGPYRPAPTDPAAFCTGEGVWYDAINDLCWQDPVADAAYVWQDAITYCEQLSLAGYDDWKMPDVDQLRSLIVPGTGGAEVGDVHCSANVIGGDCEVTERAAACLDTRCLAECGKCRIGEGPGEQDCYWNPALDGSCVDHGFWTSSIITDESDSVWGIDFKTAVIGFAQTSTELFLRCVRFGPDWSRYAGTKSDGGVDGGYDAGTGRDSGGSEGTGECQAGQYQGTMSGTYTAGGVGSISIRANLTFELNRSGDGTFDVVNGLIEGTETPMPFTADVVGQLDCPAGQTEEITFNGDYSYSTFTGTMSARYDKSDATFTGTWVANDAIYGYGGSGIWNAGWVGP